MKGGNGDGDGGGGRRGRKNNKFPCWESIWEDIWVMETPTTLTNPSSNHLAVQLLSMMAQHSTIVLYHDVDTLQQGQK